MKSETSVRRAAVAGALATVAESALMQLGMKIGGGRRPVFLPSAMVSRMAGQIGCTLDDSFARLVGNVMRAGYGPAWGIGWALLTRERPLRPLRDTCLLGSVIWAFELLMLPRLGATPRLRYWPRRDIGWDLANALAFAAIYTYVLSSWVPRLKARGRAVQSLPN